MVAMNDILEFSGQVAREFDPQRIILFGSHAYSTPNSDSDVDLMVILPFEGRPLDKTLEILNRVPYRFPLDLIVKTPDEVRRRLDMHDWFMHDVVEKGKVLYEAGDRRMGP